MNDKYKKDKEAAVKSGEPWVVIIGSSTCPPCLNLENSLNLRGVLNTKLDYKESQAIKISSFYQSKGAESVTGWPDWAVIRYKDGKLVYFKRYLGFDLRYSLDNILLKAKTQTGLSYKKGQ